MTTLKRPRLSLAITSSAEWHVGAWGEYTLGGHFLHLERLVAGTEKLRFFLYMDAGMRAACLWAFARRIKERSVDALFVRISKEPTIDQKRVLVAEARQEFEERAAAYQELTETRSIYYCCASAAKPLRQSARLRIAESSTHCLRWQSERRRVAHSRILATMTLTI
ncbi:hypothetical protein [Cupriavidus necator]